jgi:VWFA-related protein
VSPVLRPTGVLTTALLAALLSQQPPQPPTFRSAVDVVRLDVSVLDKARRPVRGLTAADFAVTVDGTPQSIVAFEEVVLPARTVPSAPWMRDIAPDVKTNALGEPRLFLIVMDDLRTPSDAYMMKTAKAVARAIVDEMLPSDLAAVIFTKNNRNAQELTSDRALLLAAVESFRPGWVPEEGVLTTAMSSAVLRSGVEILARRPQGRSAIMWITVGGGIAADADPTTKASDTLGSGADEREVARTQRDAAVAEQMGLTVLVEQNRVARIPIYGFGIAGLQAAGSATVNNMAPPELRAPQFTDRSATIGGETLQAIADATGARAVVADNEPARYVPAIFEENSSYYLIGYRASYPAADGKTRAMQIRVNRPDALVTPSARRLHAATPSARGAAASPAPPLLRAMAEIVPKSDLRLAVVATPIALIGPRYAGGAAAVLAALRVERPAPSERTNEQVEALAKVFTPEGKELMTMRQQAAVALRPADSDALFDILLPLRLKPGRYNIRYSARSANLDRTGSVYTDVIVPDFAKDRLSMSGLVLTAHPMPIAAPNDAFAAIVPIVPTTRREFERGDRVRAFTRVYQRPPNADAVQITTRISDAADRVAAEAASTLAAPRFTPHIAADFTYELPIASLTPGHYLLTVEVRLDRRTAVRRDVRFSVR